MTKLERCPFCGAEAEIVRNSSGSYFARCTNRQCAAKTRLYHENENGARLAWNRRAERTCHLIDCPPSTCARKEGWATWPKCSECGEAVRRKANYCSNCGAKVVDE